MRALRRPWFDRTLTPKKMAKAATRPVPVRSALLPVFMILPSARFLVIDDDGGGEKRGGHQCHKEDEIAHIDHTLGNRVEKGEKAEQLEAMGDQRRHPAQE